MEEWRGNFSPLMAVRGGAMKREEGRCEGAAVLKVETDIYCWCVFSVIMAPRPSNAQVSIAPQQRTGR